MLLTKFLKVAWRSCGIREMLLAVLFFLGVDALIFSYVCLLLQLWQALKGSLLGW
jgi:hypothetical protein